MKRNILELKMGDESYMIEDPDFGNPLFFIHKQTKHMKDSDFYKWLAELHFLKLTDGKKDDLEKFQKENPKMVQPDFLMQIEILAFNLYTDYFYDECNLVIDKLKMNERMQDIIRKKTKQLQKFYFG
ncbi:MAG: hypothetical protein ACLFQS_11545 [Bacteroidales bacterium]